MDNGLVTDTYFITNGYSGLFVCAMNNNCVLDIHFIPDPDRIYVAPDHSIEPNRTLVAHDHISHNSGVRRYKTVISKHREHALNR
jgi:hypothetical protein